MHGRFTIGVLLACALLGCGGQDGPPSAAAPEVPAIGPGTVASADGVEIAYTVHRAHQPALVLVHGWMCDQSYWDEQIAGLAEQFGVVTVDVAGHGASSANRESWTISSLGNDVAAVIKKLQLDEVIMVGHSMGGLVSLEVARQMPGTVVGVIGVDSLHDVDAEQDAAKTAKFLEALREDFKPTCDGFVRSMFVEDTDPALPDRIAIDMCSGPGDVGAALIQAYVEFDHAQALAGAEVPIRAINADLWPTDVAGNQELADFQATLFEGRGHFLMQEAAEKLTGSMIDHALEISGVAGIRMVELLLTSESGHKLASMEVVPFQPGSAEGTVISVYPDSTKQTIDGIGTSFTESSAFVLAHLEPERRRDVMEQIYGESGANFSLARTHIGSCDFTVKGKYSYADKPEDRDLVSFSIAPDLAGFDPAEYPGIKDPGYDLLPMIQEALAVKRGQDDRDLRIIASAWTAPPWMKNIETWYIPASPQNDWQGDAGWLKPEHVSTYSDYLVRYLDAYKSAGVETWALTPVNEPHGNGGHWESMHFSPESQNDFVKRHLGPRLQQTGHSDTKILVYDQNRDGLEAWTDVIFSDPESAKHVYGAAVHWYASTFKVFEDTFDRVHAKFPDFKIIHTEGTIDNLGNDAPGGIEDPARFKESGWFNNDAFWWNANATDWAYSATWAGPAAADHPIYTPVHRYARNIIVSLDHWVSGWVDWNIVLDDEGGPNHAGNFCGAPIMIDTTTEEVYYTPIFYVLAQFSRTIRPGDKAVRTHRTLDGLDSDALHACATINDDALLSVQLLNTTKEPITYKLQIADRYADVTMPANSVQTVRVQL